MENWELLKLSVIKNEGNPKLFRVVKKRDNLDMRNCKVSDFSYPPANVAKLGRFNAENVSVLYTSTHPSVAFKEVFDDEVFDDEVDFYMVIFKRKKKKSFNLFCIYPDEKEWCGTARDYFNIIQKKMEGLNDVKKYFKEFAKKMADKDYSKTSELASFIFSNGADALLSVSAKSNSELNYTIKKESADFMEVKYVFHCKKSVKSTCFEILDIGEVENDKVNFTPIKQYCKNKNFKIIEKVNSYKCYELNGCCLAETNGKCYFMLNKEM